MDIKTLILILALGNLTLSAALFFFAYGEKKSASLENCLLAKQFQAAAWLLLYFRGGIPDLLSIPIANGLLFAGIAFEAGAMWDSVERPGWKRVLLPLLGVAIMVFAAIHFLALHPSARVAAVSIIVSGFFLAGTGALLLDWGAASMLRRFIALGGLLLSSIILLRGVLVLALPNGVGLMSNDVVQTVTFSGLYLLMLLNGLGFLLLAKERQQAELARLSIVDPLTDAPNRRGFFNALTPWMALARRPGNLSALVMFDLDHFKRVNDVYGHPVGDLVLKTVVEIGKTQLRDSDLIGRLGGEEFAVLLPRTGLADALLVADRMRLAIMKIPIKTERAMINITASFGVTIIRADDSTVSLFKRVDEALYAAKQAGRNRVMEAPTAENG